MTSLIYHIPERLDLAGVKSRLRAGLHIDDGKSTVVRRHYVDTHDWRIFNSGAVLEIVEGGSQIKLIWRALGGFEVFSVQTVQHTPRFVWELPQGPLRERLAPIVEVRALLPIVTTEGRVQSLRSLNKDHKTVLRLELRGERVKSPRTPRNGLGERVLLFPVRGYQRELEKTAKFLQAELGATPDVRDPLVIALESIGRTPGDYSSKLRLALDPAQRTDTAAKKLLLHLLNTLEANEDGVRQDLDSEFLHDFRVAVRRTRSLLGQVKQIFPAQRVERFRREFAWLGDVTGPTRDMDVYLLNFDDYKASLPPGVRQDIAPLQVFLNKHKADEHRKLVEALDSSRYKKLLQAWRAFLEAEVAKTSKLANATRPLIEVASARIWRAYRRVLKQGNRIHADTPADALHQLRIACKKLRYLMEFFRTLYPARKIESLIKTLKGLQDNLGTFQDLEVQQHALTGFSEAMKREMELRPQTEQAMRLLIEEFGERQHRVRSEFHDRFEKFASNKHRKQFNKLFASASDVSTNG